MLPWHDGLEPETARGWTPVGSGWLERKEVIACVVITRSGSPNGSRRVARRAAALSTITLRSGSTRSGASAPDLADSRTVEISGLGSDCFREAIRLTRSYAGDYGLFFDRGWWWSWAFTRSTTGRRAEDGVSP